MPSAARDTIIVRVRPATKQSAKRGAKLHKLTLTDYIIKLIESAENAQGQQAERSA
jgi:hypothetical protein